MEKLKNIINQINTNFISEAKNALTVISDMAIMEKYIAESYDNRIIIELLQNADDAKATKVKCYLCDNFFIFANNGREFSEEDVISISRSGASKKTKDSIGFRGIGFKSVVSLTNDILIYSSGTAFTFSKHLTSKELGLPFDKIPTVRIPFYVDKNNINKDIINEITSLENQGYTTIFIFNQCKKNIISHEIDEINKNYFIFLNSILEFEGETDTNRRVISISRTKNEVKICEESSVYVWKIMAYENSENNIKIAFLCDNNIIKSCNETEHKLTCFLPTLNSSPIACIINGAFRTDPARKHLQNENFNYDLMRQAGKLFCEEIIKYCNGLKDYNGIFNVLNSRKSYDDFSECFFNELNSGLKKYVIAKSLRFFSSDYDVNEINLLKQYFNVDIKVSDSDYYDAMMYLSRFTEDEISSGTIIELLTQKRFIDQISEAFYIKILVLGVKEVRAVSLIKGSTFKLDNILSYNKIPIVNDYEYLQNVIIPNISLQLSSEDMKWVYKQLGIKKENFEGMKYNVNVCTVEKNFTISKWRTAEQQCVDIEKYLGNTAQYVGNKNLGYDVESIDKLGDKRYIEVKLLKNKQDSFSLTNNEYNCAHQYGDNYFICLIYSNEGKISATYIKNPLKNVIFEKRVKNFEWYCENYNGKEYTFILNQH